MLDENGAVPAAVFGEVGAGVHAVFVPVATQQQAVPLAQGQVVLPGDLITVGVEHEAFGAELVALVVAVLAVGQFQPRMPDVGELGVEVAAQAADAEIGVRLLAVAFEGDRVEAAERVVVFAAATAVEQVQAGSKRSPKVWLRLRLNALLR